MNALAAALLCAVLAGCAAPLPSATTTAAPTASATPTPQPSLAARCVPWPLTSSVPDDPCPTAIVAADDVVAPLGLPIARLTMAPGYFGCGDPWLTPGSPAPGCPVDVTPPGQWMHGWVSFVGSPKVAAVLLGRPLPIAPGPSGTLSPSPAPWQATVRAFDVPPAGWAFPILLP